MKYQQEPEIKMKKTIIAVVMSATLAACGGGDDEQGGAGPAIRLTYSGAPMVAVQTARAMAVTADSSSQMGAGGALAGGQATISALQAAFKARAADVGVYPGVIDGTTLRQLVMAENGGEPPSGDALNNTKVSVSEWSLVNFQFDDMSGYIDSPEREAAVEQFGRDLAIYAAREYLKGRMVFAALPIVSCAPAKAAQMVDASGNVVPKTQRTASAALYDVIANSAKYETTTTTPYGPAKMEVREFRPVGGARPTAEHMGADCNSPDAATRDAYMAGIVDPLVEQYQIAVDTIDKCKHNPEAIPEYERAGQCWGIEPEKK